MERVDKPWGYELRFVRTERYAGKVLFVKAGSQLSLQFHEKKDEAFFVQEGILELVLGKGAEQRRKDQHAEALADLVVNQVGQVVVMAVLVVLAGAVMGAGVAAGEFVVDLVRVGKQRMLCHGGSSNRHATIVETAQRCAHRRRACCGLPTSRGARDDAWRPAQWPLGAAGGLLFSGGSGARM